MKNTIEVLTMTLRQATLVFMSALVSRGQNVLILRPKFSTQVISFNLRCQCRHKHGTIPMINMMKIVFYICVLTCLMFVSEVVGQTKRERLIMAGHDLGALYSGSSDFYGLFVKKQLIDNWYDFEIRRINIKDYATAPETVDHERIKTDKLVYVLSGFDSLNTNIRGWKFESGYLIPGQSLLAGGYHIYAKGQIIETKDSTSTEVFDAIENYYIGVKLKLDERIIDQRITQGYRLERWNIGNYLGGIKVDWVGDLNGDGRPEIIMIECGHHECFDLVLYSPDKTFKIREVQRTTVCGG